MDKVDVFDETIQNGDESQNKVTTALDTYRFYAEKVELEALLRESNVATKKFEDNKSLSKEGRDTENLRDKENREIMFMRKVWCYSILFIIIAIIIFDIVLVSLYGLGIWNFDNPNVVIAVITDNFLKIFWLGWLITDSLVKKIF